MSNESLGLGKAGIQTLYPAIKRNVGFSVSDVPQAMMEEAKSIGVKISPANPNQVKRDKTSGEEIEKEDNFSEGKYRHNVANHTTLLQGICRLPFNIFQCTAFLD